jgi:hypothetical protein
MSKMASHEPFGHMQPKLLAKEGSGIKVTVWLLTTKSQELTSSQHSILECDMVLESSWRELQLWFRPRLDRTLQSGDMSFQKFRDSNPRQFRDSNLEVLGKRTIRIWLPRSNAKNTTRGKVVASPEFGPWWVKCVKVPMVCPHTQGCSQMLTNPFVVGFGCKFQAW